MDYFDLQMIVKSCREEMECLILLFQEEKYPEKMVKDVHEAKQFHNKKIRK